MFPWLQQIKRYPAGESEAGGTLLVDPGAPYEHGIDAPPAEEVKKPDPAAEELKSLREQVNKLSKRNEELSASERHWATEAQKRTAHRESDDEPAPTDPAEPELNAETAEQFLDDVSKQGLAALKKRGLVTIDQVNKLIKETIERTVAEVRTDSGFDAQLNQEFPEIAADTRRVQNGEQPQSELYIRAAKLYRESVRLDPALGKSKSALILAARTAAAQLEAEGKSKPKPAKAEATEVDDERSERESRRRERIKQQTPERGAPSSDEDDSTPSLTVQQREVMKHLKVSENDFLKNSDRRASAR